MKKEIIISIVIVILIVLFDIITQKYTNFAMNDIAEILANLRDDLVNNREQEASQKIETAQERWEDVKEKMVIYIEHDELEKVEMCIIESKSYMQTKEYTMAIEAIDKCNFIMNHIKDKYELSLENIF